MPAKITGERANHRTFECPTCGALNTRIRDRDVREEGYTIIKRVCRSGECPVFCTVETVVYEVDGTLASFGNLAPNKRLEDRLRQQVRKGYGGRRAIKAIDHLQVIVRYIKGFGVSYDPRECYKGHPYNEENSYRNKDGKLVCRVCRRETQRLYIQNHGPKYRKRQQEYQRKRRARLRAEAARKAA